MEAVDLRAPTPWDWAPSLEWINQGSLPIAFHPMDSVVVVVADSSATAWEEEVETNATADSMTSTDLLDSEVP